MKYSASIIRKTFYFLFSTVLIPVNAEEIQYNKFVELSGYLTQEVGIGCCTNGEEEKINYPVIKLRTPINVFSSNRSKPDIDEPPELGVTVMHLVLNDRTWRIFKKYKGKTARVLCSPYHAINSHHMTPVLCEVKSISKP